MDEEVAFCEKHDSYQKIVKIEEFPDNPNANFFRATLECGHWTAV